MNLLVLIAALLLDRFIGDPDEIWRRYPHPVVGFGKLVGWVDHGFNDEALAHREREKRGGVSIAALILGSVLFGHGLSIFFGSLGIIGYVIEVLIVAVFLAQKSLSDHVQRVAEGLRQNGLDGGRAAVSMIVGRDPKTLDEAGVSRAAIESLAENFSDGVVAPAFWYGVFGLPGLFAYKMINTADSMIGHKTARHLAFGRFAARIDDLANWLPARLTMLLLLAVHPRGRKLDAVEVVMADAPLHRSVNAGWPETAMAYVLDLALGGPRIYAGDRADEPFLHADGRKDAGEADIEKALVVYGHALWLGFGLAMCAALIVSLF